MIRGILALGALAACGGTAAPDAGLADGACVGTLSGNLAEPISAAECAALVREGDGQLALRLDIPSAVAATTFGVEIELGPAPAVGAYGPATVTAWSALALRDAAPGTCVYRAGATAVPAGSFALTLDALDAGTLTAHGSLEVVLYVLAVTTANCGPGDTETISIAF
ncbi:MAG: hypothetical protein K8W52_28095 [Deltaproteobacteria bacterium]|nr:hypothetical protein [Deltaproteobacteria bacterium]